MIHLKRVGFILAATAVLATSLACEKEPDNTGNDTEKDFRDEIVGTYTATNTQDFTLVSPSPADAPDALSHIEGVESNTFEIEKDPSDAKAIIVKFDNYPLEFVSAKEVSDGALFNLKSANAMLRDKNDGTEYKVIGGKQLYWLIVNGKKTKLYHASFDSIKKTFDFAMSVETKIESNGKTLTYSGTMSVEGKKQ